MNIFNNKKIYIFLTLFLLILIVFSLLYFEYVNNKKNYMQGINYETQAKSMKSRVAEMIYQKQKATIAIGLVLVQDKHLIQEIKSRTVKDDFYKELVARLKKDTEYKNIWVQIVDKKLNSIYRSWTHKKGDNLRSKRPDLAKALKSKEVSYSVSSGIFALTIKASIPVLENGKVVGILELISHFNSIALTLEKFHIDSVVVLNKEQTQNLKYPFTNKFIDGYYVANFAASKEKMEYLKSNGIENYFSSDYKVENGYIITSYPLVSFDGKTLGHYIMFKSLKNVSKADEDFFLFKWLAIGFIFILLLAGVVNLILLYIMAKQKAYVRNIIDSSTNIVIINDKKTILDVNKAFFKFFNKEKDLDDFRNKYSCVCDLFSNEEGYVQKKTQGLSWIDYILTHQDETHKVKIKYYDKVYYFTVGVSLVSPEKDYYSAVFTDVTREETYKLELEKLTITDSLTNIGNRRFYNAKIEENISLAARYKFPLSIIMVDIDHFKKVNDKYGHGVGDNVLIEYTDFISKMIRDADIFCRLGGEEFIIIVPYADKQKAEQLAQKLRKGVEKHKVILPITMSFGVTQYIPGEDADHILTRADEALYTAKENGRNQVVCK